MDAFHCAGVWEYDNVGINGYQGLEHSAKLDGLHLYSFLEPTRVKRIPETCMSSCVGDVLFFVFLGATVVNPSFGVARSCVMGLVGVVWWTCGLVWDLLRLAPRPAWMDRLPEAMLLVLGASGGFWLLVGTGAVFLFIVDLGWSDTSGNLARLDADGVPRWSDVPSLAGRNGG